MQLIHQTPDSWLSDFVNHSYGYRPKWTPLSPITIIDSIWFPQQRVIMGVATPLSNKFSVIKVEEGKIITSQRIYTAIFTKFSKLKL